MNQKLSKKMLLLLAAVLAACLAVMLLAQPKKAPLPRDKDTEFDKGSDISVDTLSALQAESLYKLCKVWGYAKYHHPSVIDGSLNWDAELLRVMPKILSAASASDANSVLYTWLSQFPFESMETEEAKAWKEIHETYGIVTADTAWISDDALLGEDLCGYLEKLSAVYTTDRDDSYASFTEQSGDNYGYVNFGNEKQMTFSPEDDGVKLLALFRFWNIYEYYSPNRRITKTDWDTVLRDSIPRLLEADTYQAYALAIARAASQTADGHLTVRDKELAVICYYGKYFLPCTWKQIDGQIVVAAAPAASGLKPGDVLLSIDGKTVNERIEELRPYFALPEENKIEQCLQVSLISAASGNADVEVLRGSETLSLSVKTGSQAYTAQNPYKNGLLTDAPENLPADAKIGYIDPAALKEGDVQKLMEAFADTQGIIIDLRRYPSVFIPYLMGEYITPEPTDFTLMSFANQAIPGAFAATALLKSGAGTQQLMGDDTAYPAYGGKVILLMDETSVSQSEFTVMALRQSPNAVVVGSPSFGADGNIVHVSLPGSISFNISGLGVYTPDGGQTQRVGLSPDIECRPTVEGLREGRDELIEKAVALISG